MRPSFLWTALAGCAVVLGCAGPPRSEWPRATILTTEPAAVFFTGQVLETYAFLDGTILEIRREPAQRIVELLEEGYPADVVIVDDSQAWEEADRRGLLAPEPWRVTCGREDVLVVTVEGSEPPESGGVIAVEPLERYQHARPVHKALERKGVLGLADFRLLQVEGLDSMLEAVRQGRAWAAAMPAGRWGEGIEGWSVYRRLDWRPEAPRSVRVGISSTTSRPVDARRLWNYVEKSLRGQGMRWAAPET